MGLDELVKESLGSDSDGRAITGREKGVAERG